MTKEELKVNLKAQNRTTAQSEAMRLKKAGYIPVKVYDEFDNLVIIAYKIGALVTMVDIKDFKPENYDFVYYN